MRGGAVPPRGGTILRPGRRISPRILRPVPIGSGPIVRMRCARAPGCRMWLFFNRLQLGFYSVLARLDVDVDYNALDMELLGDRA